MKKKRCIATTLNDTQCKKNAIEGGSFCRIHNNDGGGNTKKPSGGGKGAGGIGGEIGKIGFVVAVKETITAAWEWIKENPDIFLTATQMALYVKINNQENKERQQEQIEKLFSTFSTEQWSRIILAVGTEIIKKSSKGKIR